MSRGDGLRRISCPSSAPPRCEQAHRTAYTRHARRHLHCSRLKPQHLRRQSAFRCYEPMLLPTSEMKHSLHRKGLSTSSAPFRPLRTVAALSRLPVRERYPSPTRSELLVRWGKIPRHNFCNQPLARVPVCRLTLGTPASRRSDQPKDPCSPHSSVSTCARPPIPKND